MTERCKWCEKEAMAHYYNHVLCFTHLLEYLNRREELGDWASLVDLVEEATFESHKVVQ